MRNFVTLFDHKFLPQGLALHESLVRHGGEFRLFILCVDEIVERQLDGLQLLNVVRLPLRDFETPALAEARNNRSHGEYCWTLASHSLSFVKQACPEVEQVTYVDADLFFFASPEPFFAELEQSGKDMLITEHAFAPEYAPQAQGAGRFCVQFLTVNFTPTAKTIIANWQKQCRTSCAIDGHDGVYGDQKYLDQWPDLYADTVHILRQSTRTLAPWNVEHVRRQTGQLQPIFYHFHGFRIVGSRRVQTHFGFRVGKCAWRLYQVYLSAIRSALMKMRQSGIDHVPCLPIPRSRTGLEILRRLKWRFVSRVWREARL